MKWIGGWMRCYKGAGKRANLFPIFFINKKVINWTFYIYKIKFINIKREKKKERNQTLLIQRKNNLTLFLFQRKERLKHPLFPSLYGLYSLIPIK